MNLNKIVNEINGTVKKSKIRTCGYLGQTKVEQLREYPEIDLKDLLLAFSKINFNPFLKISYDNLEIGSFPRIDIDLTKPLSKQKPEVTKKLIEILS